MKAVPEIGLNGLYIEDVLEGDSFTGVLPIYAQSEAEEAPELTEVVEPIEEEPDAPETRTRAAKRDHRGYRRHSITIWTVSFTF